MFLNGYSVRVPNSHRESDGYVQLRHGQTYTLVLRNGNSTRCDARVEVDGKMVGLFRINAYSNLTLERPSQDTGKFTFYKLGTHEANQVGLDSGSSDLGLVKVTFTPEDINRPRPTEIVQEPKITWTYSPSYTVPTYWSGGGVTGTITTSKLGGGRGMSAIPCNYDPTPTADCYNLSAGGTGLSGHSNQRFHDVAALDYDYSRQTTIHLRLVCADNDTPRPLMANATPVPPRIG